MKTVNKYLDDLRKNLKEITTSLAYNEESRLIFTRKVLLSSVKNLKELVPDYTTEI